MKKSLPIAIVAIILIGLLVYFAINQGKTYRWHTGFTPAGQEPYDLMALLNTLQESYQLQPLNSRIEKSFPKGAGKGTAYLFVGSYAFYTNKEAKMLLEYVKRGGQAFIACEQRLPDSLMYYLIDLDDCDPYDRWSGAELDHAYTDSILTQFTHPSLEKFTYNFKHLYDFQSSSYSWAYIRANRVCENTSYPIAQLGVLDPSFLSNNSENTMDEFLIEGDDPTYYSKYDEPSNFIRIEYGEGYFFFHTNPILFSNLFLVQPKGFSYLKKVFAHLDANTIYWDAKSRERPRSTTTMPPRENEVRRTESPFAYIFSQPTLRWAFYILMSLGLLYAIFRAKRKQRVIPILPSNRNTSLEFVQTIALLYFQQQNHRNILEKQMHLFFVHLRQRYHIHIRDWENTATYESLLKRIVVRTDVSEMCIRKIFDTYANLKQKMEDQNVEVSAETLNAFYLLIDRFHKEAEAAVRKKLEVAESSRKTSISEKEE